MSTLVFVLVWVTLGLGLVLLAMSGGAGGLLARLQSQTRLSRRMSIAGFLVALVVLGIGVPAAVIAAVSDRESIPEAGVAELTPEEQRGRELFGDRCATCHALEAAKAAAQVGPDLDELRPNARLVLDAIENGRARGNGQMAADLYTGQDAKDVAAFVAKAVGAE
jgi:mono/diheme cytochrome c family protein